MSPGRGGIDAVSGLRPAVVLTASIALLGLEQLHSGRHRSWVPPAVAGIVRDLAYHGPNEEDELGLQAGYYDALFEAGRDATRPDDPEAGFRDCVRLDESHERTRDFVLYRLRPGLDLVNAGGERVVTNRFGMADRDYEPAKPAGTRRIAFAGDSLVRGLGAPFGRALEPRLEEWLGATQTNESLRAIEVLNFGVEGYRLTQVVDVVAKRIPSFAPDAVLVGISDLGASRNFGYHVAQLVHDGIDLEYPFLKELAARAGLRREESLEEAQARLSALRREVVAGCLAELAARAAAMHAGLVAVLIPTVTESDRLEPRFREARELLSAARIPTLDLLDTFAGVADLAPLRVSAVDHHPNERGYALLLERLKQRLAADPDAATALLGRALR